jgi:hypothetical protein
MTITTQHQCHDSDTADARRRRRRAIGMIVGRAATIALLALFDTGRAGANDTTVASGPVHLVDQAFVLPGSSPTAAANSPTPRVQEVDDTSDLLRQLLQQQQNQDQAQLSENNAIQSMIQSEQQAEEQNDQAEQQFTQDELQAQETEQEADQS